MKSLIFHREFYLFVNDLTECEQLKMYTAIFEYAFKHTLPKDLNANLSNLFEQIKPKIEVVDYEI